MKQEFFYKVVTTFMIIDLTKNVLYVIHAVPENKIEASWLMGELNKCIKCLHLKGFNVKPELVTIIPLMSPPTKKFLLYTEKIKIVPEFILKISQYIYSMTLYTLSRTSEG